MEKLFNFITKNYNFSSYMTLDKKWSFPLSVSSANVTKSAVSCANPFFVQCDFFVSYIGVNEWLKINEWLSSWKQNFVLIIVKKLADHT